MQIIISVANPLVFYLAGFCSVVYPLVWLQKHKQKVEKSPITGHLLRSPGASLQSRIDDLSVDITAYIAVVSAFPLLTYSLYLPLNHVQKTTTTSVVILVGCVIVMLSWIGFKVYRLMTERNNCRLGLDAEMAVGQELNQLMVEGCRVYHDFPAENFNIDHIVVGPMGVFAVETKGRTKALKRKGKVDATVTYDGKLLQFPNSYETEPLLQAQRQADWLRVWLTSAVGDSVYTQPVLVLPGWYVVRKADRPIKVISGKEAYSLAKPSGINLSAEMIQRIAHQVEQRCRDVEPIAYRQEKKG
ncbi:nuclease-related domain-containing protein [uncultured Desulfuromusa sp.]|uniref:nuclease-related domain-containing protein n=1 Tax=uncultured Desulfuromusa sp. TaxID=219183 RepID=UPI002AA5F43B|nr:nuclease-related domain-containing protein [uncultured Desulfuromusa sp.]